MNKAIIKNNIAQAYIIIILFAVAVSVLGNYLLLDKTIYYNSLPQSMGIDEVESIISNSNKWIWVSYVITIFVIVIKTLTISSVISLGFYVNYNKTYFKSICLAVIQGEFIFIIPAIVKIFWFSLFKSNYSLEDLQFFYPLSLLNILDFKSVDIWLIYPLEVANIFEVFYIIFVSLIIAKSINKSIFHTLKISFIYYSSFLLTWTLFIIFLVLNSQ